MAKDVVTTTSLPEIVSRIENLEEQKADIAIDIAALYAQAKSNGFDVKSLREIIRERRLEPAVLSERLAILDTYRDALGHLDGTPLGQAALTRLHDEVVSQANA